MTPIEVMEDAYKEALLTGKNAMRAALQALIDYEPTEFMTRGAAHELANRVPDIDQAWSECKGTAVGISKAYLRATLNEHPPKERDL